MQELVYHGTNRIFDQFSRKHLGETWGINSGGFYFTSKKEVAREYANTPFFSQLISRASLKAVFACKLDMKNPLILDIVQVNSTNKHGFFRNSSLSPEQLDIILLDYIVNKLNKGRYKRKDSILGISNKKIRKRCSKYVSKLIKGNTPYDGIIIKNASDKPIPDEGDFPISDIYVALNPKQISIVEVDIEEKGKITSIKTCIDKLITS